MSTSAWVFSSIAIAIVLWILYEIFGIRLGLRSPRKPVHKDIGRVVVHVVTDGGNFDFEFKGWPHGWFSGEPSWTDANYFAKEFVNSPDPIDIRRAIARSGKPITEVPKEDAVQEHTYYPRKRVVLYESKREPLMYEFQ